MTMRFSRRAFLCILGALGPLQALVAGRGRRVGADPVSLAEFVALSERLTGHRSLNRGTARTYLEALLDVPARPRAVGRPGAPQEHAARCRRPTPRWRHGSSRPGTRACTRSTAPIASADYAGALMWTALNRPAFGFCAGETGSWSRARRVEVMTADRVADVVIVGSGVAGSLAACGSPRPASRC